MLLKTTGARSLMIIFRLLRRARDAPPRGPPGATDNTRRDTARAARPARSFLTHHIHKPTSVISTAIQAADAQTILNAAGARMLRVSYWGHVRCECILSGQ